MSFGSGIACLLADKAAVVLTVLSITGMGSVFRDTLHAFRAWQQESRARAPAWVTPVGRPAASMATCISYVSLPVSGLGICDCSHPSWVLRKEHLQGVSAHLIRTQMFIHVGRSESQLHWHWLPWPLLFWLRPLLLAVTRCWDLRLVHQGLSHVKGGIGILYKARNNRSSFLRATAHTSCVLCAAKIFSC